MKTIWAQFINYKELIAVLILTFISVLPLFHAGFYPTHDGEYHIIRFYEFDIALRDGNWFPIWAKDLNFGYGVPLFNYVYPFPNYIASLIHSFGPSFIDAFQISMIAASFVGAVSMYAWSRLYFGKKSGLVSSVFYTYAPYHFLDIYIRGSIGEVWALALFPLFLFLFSKGCLIKSQKYFLCAGIVFACIIFSHNIMAFIFALFAASYSLVLYLQTMQKWKIFLGIFITFSLGLMLSSVFWLPALLEKKYVVGLETSHVKDNFPEIFQILIPSWGSGFSGASLDNQMSFQIGVANLLAVFICTVVLLTKKIPKNMKYLVAFLLLWFFVLLFMMLPTSSNVWNIPFLDYIQFSWRLLSLVILVCAFIAGFVVSKFNNKIFIGLLVFMVLATTYFYAKPAYYFNRSDMHYISRSNFIDGTNSPGNSFNTKWMTPKVKRADQLIKTNTDGVKITPKFKSSSKYIFNTKSEKNIKADINIAYFPGWRAYIDSKPTAINIKSNGTMQVSIPEGEHVFALILEDTTPRITGKILFWIGIMLTAYVLLGRQNLLQLKREDSNR